MYPGIEIECPSLSPDGPVQRASTGDQNGPFQFSPVSDSFIYKLGMYQIPYKSGMSQFQPLQFSMPSGGGGGREREQRYAGAGGDVRPLPLGRGGQAASLDRVWSGCSAGERAALRRAWRGLGCGAGGRGGEVGELEGRREGRRGGLGRRAPPGFGRADARRTTMAAFSRSTHG